jgi:hypothetical protein
MSEELNDAFIFAELDRLGYDSFIGCEYIPAGGTVDGLGWFAEYRPRLGKPLWLLFWVASLTIIRALPISRIR